MEAQLLIHYATIPSGKKDFFESFFRNIKSLKYMIRIPLQIKIARIIHKYNLKQFLEVFK